MLCSLYSVQCSEGTLCVRAVVDYFIALCADEFTVSFIESPPTTEAIAVRHLYIAVFRGERHM